MAIEMTLNAGPMTQARRASEGEQNSPWGCRCRRIHKPDAQARERETPLEGAVRPRNTSPERASEGSNTAMRHSLAARRACVCLKARRAGVISPRAEQAGRLTISMPAKAQQVTPLKHQGRSTTCDFLLTNLAGMAGRWPWQYGSSLASGADCSLCNIRREPNKHLLSRKDGNAPDQVSRSCMDPRMAKEEKRFGPFTPNMVTRLPMILAAVCKCSGPASNRVSAFS